MGNTAKIGCALAALVLLGGCVASKKVIVDSYTPPSEYQKVKGLLEREGSDSDEGRVLSIGIDPEVRGGGSATPQIAKLLLSDLKTYITQTNFISLYPLYEEAPIKLNMEILEYRFVRSGGHIDAYLNVNFSLSRALSEQFSKSYDKSAKRFSKSEQTLPGEPEIMQYLVDHVAKRFIQDLSPLRTKQLREFKPFPAGLESVMGYVQNKNYEGAIETMERYQGTRSADYYYNLAVIYEAVAAKNEDIQKLESAYDNYDTAMMLSGGSDEMIVKSKARFETYYRLFFKVSKQRKANERLEKRLEKEYGVTY